MGGHFRTAFVVFHITLGAVIFLQSTSTILRASSSHTLGALGGHSTILAAVEAIAALLFLLPKTTRVGSVILLVVFAIALAIHGIRGELTLLVYAAGVVLVMMEGGSYKLG